MIRRLGLITLVGFLLAATAPAGQAGPLDQRVVSAAFQFVPGETTLVKGEVLEFTNLDPAPHNLIALRNGPDGKPWFRTDTISAGRTVPVKGIEKLPPGIYDYTCTVHPRMLGTVFVEPAGG